MDRIATVRSQAITLGDLLRESTEVIIFEFNRECGHGTERYQPRQQDIASSSIYPRLFVIILLVSLR
jgi:hypothetical protein